MTIPSRADAAAIVAASRGFADALWHKDRRRLMDLFTDDVLVLPPNRPAVSGREAAVDFWMEAVADPTVQIKSEFDPLEVEVRGDLAYETGRVTVSVHRGADMSVADRGKYLVVWKRLEGAWRIHRDIFNSDLVAAAHGREPDESSA